MSNLNANLLKISAVLWIVWGAVHMLAGAMTMNFVLSGDIAGAVAGIACRFSDIDSGNRYRRCYS